MGGWTRQRTSAAWCMAVVVCTLPACAPKGSLRVPDVTRATPVERTVTVADADGRVHDLDGERGVPVQALVGQVAGQPIYAHAVLRPLETQLEALGRREGVAAFDQRAGELIQQRVQSIVQDALLLDEASRALEPRQRMGLEAYLEYQRQEYLRRYGQGSQALAERRMIEETGQGLRQTLDDLRDGILIRSYLERNLDPLINVTRLDIERYYRDNAATFNPPAERAVHLIYTTDPDDAAAITSALEGGEPFAQVAAGPLNDYPGQATLYEYASDSAFGPEVDPAVVGLQPGEWAGPLRSGERFYFVHLQRLEQKPRRTLMEAQVDIERALRDRQAFELRNDFARRLRERASVSDEQRMTRDVLAIARARYAAHP